jgi:hypothetical protein
MNEIYEDALHVLQTKKPKEEKKVNHFQPQDQVSYSFFFFVSKLFTVIALSNAIAFETVILVTAHQIVTEAHATIIPQCEPQVLLAYVAFRRS